MQPLRLHLSFVLLLIVAGIAAAHETDQFEVPPDRKFADLGDYFNQWAYRAIDQGVNVTNTEIRRAIEAHAPPSVLAELQSAPHVTMAVRTQWPWSVTQIETFEKVLASPEMRRRYPGRVVAYGDRFNGVYQWAFLPFDIRQYAHILFFSSTMKVYGVYLGTDKLGHFTDEGIAYYFAWRAARDGGASEHDAVAAAVRLGTDGLMSESGMLGLMANADYANGDVAANFAGFLFYRNLTEPMMLKGRVMPAMLVREGDYWKIAEDVRPDSGFFSRFVSDHLDEALNPGYFDDYLRPALRDAVRARRAALLQHYCDDQGRPHDRAWFDQKLRELRTYWGVDYGHRGKYNELVSIGCCCFPGGSQEKPAAPVFAQATLASARTTSGRAPLGRSALHLAAERTDPTTIRKLAMVSPEVDARDDLGRTSLHEAARVGSEQGVRALLEGGANPAATDDYGTTPLHLACRRGDLAITKLLLAYGGNANARNAAGSTPLHEAASVGDLPMAGLLLDHGASISIADGRGRRPDDVAQQHGFAQMAGELRAPHLAADSPALADLSAGGGR